MKNSINYLQKLIMAGMFIITIGFGVSYSWNTSQNLHKNVSLSALLNKAMADDESGGGNNSNTGPGSIFDCTNWLGKKIGEGRTCESRNSYPCTDKNCE